VFRGKLDARKPSRLAGDDTDESHGAVHPAGDVDDVPDLYFVQRRHLSEVV
jgi:hypothetical protein